MRTHTDTASKLVIGWREWIHLPELGLPPIKAKVDTGARTSALHAFELDVEETADGPFVNFAIHPEQGPDSMVARVRAPIVDQREVTDSGGHKEERYVITTPVAIAGNQWPIELTLTTRDTMRFRMLLGRTAMRGRILVDPAASYLGNARA
jgi:hypothetical protein